MAAPGLEVLGGMAGSGGLLEPSGLGAEAAASDVAGMAPPGIAFAGLAQLPLAPTFGAFALAVVPMDLAFAAPAVGMVLLDASAPWSCWYLLAWSGMMVPVPGPCILCWFHGFIHVFVPLDLYGYILHN